MQRGTTALRGAGAFDVKLAIEHRFTSPFVRFAFFSKDAKVYHGVLKSVKGLMLFSVVKKTH